MSDNDQDLTGRTIGDFVLQERVAVGGSSDVYRAEQPSLSRSVAVKILHEHKDSQLHEFRFEREARLASIVDHPLTTRVISYGRIDERPWIAMEYVDGQSLAKWLEVNGPMPLDEFVPFFDQLAEVVHHLHTLGIVHRDIKPSNVMMAVSNGRVTPKLIDLGIAKIPTERANEISLPSFRDWRKASLERKAEDTVTASISITITGKGMGSMPYMPPEQWGASISATSASDIYALGVLAYEALIGRLPFEGRSAHEFRYLHLSAFPASVDGPFASDLNPIFRKALAKSPKDRHASALKLAADFRHAQQAKQRRRATRARAIVVTLAAALAIAVVTGVTLGILRYRDEMRVQLAEANARAAEQVADAVKTESEVEQGRSALLSDLPNAEAHLSAAYNRGDHSRATEFMLARAIQPRLHMLAEFPSSSGRMWSASFSPDGQKIVTTDDQDVQIWDASSYQRLQLLPHHSAVYQAVFSADSAKLVTVTRPVVRIWDAFTGSLLHELKGGRPEASRGRTDGMLNYAIVAISPNGHYVAAIDVTGSPVDIWDAASGALVAELHLEAVGLPSITFSANSQWLAASGGAVAHLFAAQTWKPTQVIQQPHVQSLSFAPGQDRLLVGTKAGDVSLWTIPQGTRIHHLAELGPPISAVAWSPDGRLVAAGNQKGAVQVWRSDSGEHQAELATRATRILSLEFDPSSSLVVTGNLDGTVVVGDAASGIATDVFEGSNALVRTAHFAPRSNRVIAASWDGAAKLWDATPTYRRWSSPSIDDNCLLVTSEPIEQRIVAAACKGHPTQVWDVAADKLLLTLPSASKIDDASVAPAISPSLQKAAIAQGNKVAVYDIATGRLAYEIDHGAPVTTIYFTKDDNVLSGAMNGSLWLTQANGAVVQFPGAHATIDSAVELSDGRIAATDAKRQLHVFNQSGPTLAVLDLGLRGALRVDGASAVIFPSFAVDATDPVVVDLDSYRVINRLVGQVGRVFSVRWIANKQILITDGDGVSRWDGLTGKFLQHYQSARSRFLDAIATPDGLVIAGDADGWLRFWDAGSAVQIWAFQAHKSHIEALHVADGEVVTFGFSGEVAHWKLLKFSEVIDACKRRPRCAIVPP